MSFTCSGCRKCDLPATCFEVYKGVQRLTCLACKATRARSYAKKNMNKPKMVNAWVEHIKAFAKKNNVPFGCALSNPECRRTYSTKSEKLSQGRASAFESLSGIAGKAKATQAAKVADAKAAQAAKVAEAAKAQAAAAKTAPKRRSNKNAAPELTEAQKERSELVGLITKTMAAYGVTAKSVPRKKNFEIFNELEYAVTRSIDRFGTDDKPPGQSDVEYALAALIDPSIIIKKIMG